MARPPVLLAKLSAPKVFGALARERLFASLDAERQRRAIWIAAPPGAGKTTLVASYLRARALPGFWYQVDGGDADPASFFYYLAQGAPGARRRSAPLSLLAPEYLVDLAGFTRRFWRAYFARLQSPSALVLDNFQEAGASAPLHAIVAAAIAEAPGHISVVVISRADPSAAFAHAIANGLVARVGADDLRLTSDETRAIATAQHPHDEATLQLLERESAGWAAGLVLMLQQLQLAGWVGTGLPAATREAVFAYFAGQVFERVAEPTRALLLATAYLPRVTVEAAGVLSGDGEAGALLEQLYRERLFTDRHESETIGYEYHALFRDFLRSRIDATFTAEARGELRTRSAALLAAGGDAGAALSLYVDNADWDAATALIVERARGLIAEGRWLTLKAWVALLPREHVATTPALLLWLGSSQILVDPPKARALLVRAFERFVAEGDRLGQALAATGAIESINIEFADFAALDPWIEVLARLLDEGLVFPTATTHLRVHAAVMLATMLRQPAHPLLPPCLAYALASLDADIAVTLQADTATQLLQYFDFTGDLRGALALVERAAPLFARADLTPFRRAGWLVFLSYHSALIGSYRAGFAAVDELRAIARDYGMTSFGFLDTFFRSLLHLLGPMPLAAAPLVQQLAGQVRSASPAEVAQYHVARVLLCQARGEASLAIYHGELCLEAARGTGGVLFNVLLPAVVASAYVEAGQPQRALVLVRAARALADGTPYAHHEALLLLVEAYAEQACGATAAARALLARALVRGDEDQTASLFRWLVVGFRRLLAHALEAGIEPERARALVVRYAIAAESAEVVVWPWPIRIHALGRFAVEAEGATPGSSRKVQKKPLDLLKVIVALGAREVPVGAVGDALWPDAEGDAAAESLKVTLRRLRKLLGSDEAIVLKDAKLTLHAGRCWLDTWAFERAHDRAEAALAGDAAAADAPAIDVLCERALALYGGRFLAGDDEQPWQAGCRRRLASKFVHLVGAVGARWEDSGAGAKAELAYQRALELEPLADPLRRRLVQLQARAGRRADIL